MPSRRRFITLSSASAGLAGLLAVVLIPVASVRGIVDPTACVRRCDDFMAGLPL